MFILKQSLPCYHGSLGSKEQKSTDVALSSRGSLPLPSKGWGPSGKVLGTGASLGNGSSPLVANRPRARISPSWHFCFNLLPPWLSLFVSLRFPLSHSFHSPLPDSSSWHTLYLCPPNSWAPFQGCPQFPLPREKVCPSSSLPPGGTQASLSLAQSHTPYISPRRAALTKRHTSGG